MGRTHMQNVSQMRLLRQVGLRRGRCFKPAWSMAVMVRLGASIQTGGNSKRLSVVGEVMAGAKQARTSSLKDKGRDMQIPQGGPANIGNQILLGSSYDAFSGLEQTGKVRNSSSDH